MSVAHDHHSIRVHNGFQSVSDGEHSGGSEGRSDGLLYQAVGFRVDASRCFVDANYLD